MTVLEISEEILSKLEQEQQETHIVKIDLITDAGINPRQVDIKYAEQIPLSVPAILLGIIKNDNELENKLIIIDGNHRLYSFMNVHNISKCYAKIKFYSNRMEAIIDAYKMNINHGKRLTDKEISDGIRKTLLFLKGNTKDNYIKLAKLLNISVSSMYEYIIWDKIERILGEEVGKMKANKMNILLKNNNKERQLTQEETLEKEKQLKKFWSLNKNLSVINIVKATRLCKSLGKIVDYERYTTNLALSTSNYNDGLEEESKRKLNTVEINIEETKIEQQKIIEVPKEENDIDIKKINPDDFYQKEIFSDNKPKEIIIDYDLKKDKDPVNFIKSQATTDNNTYGVIIDNEEKQEEILGIQEEKKIEVEDKKEDDNVYVYSPEENIEEGESIEIIQTKKPKNDIADIDISYKEPETKNNLVQVKGLVRKYTFDSVMENIFDELQENVLESKGILEETLEKELHNHRKEFEDSKNKYLAVIENCKVILNSMVKTIERANRDYKGE